MSGPADPMTSTLTHGHLAKALGVTVTTIKSYRRKFPEFWKVASLGKPIRFAPESLELSRRIKELFRQGLSVEEVRKRLALEFEVAAEPARERQVPPAAPAGDALARMESLLEGLFSLQNRTHSLLAELVSKLDTLADRARGDGAGEGHAVPCAAVARPLRTMAHGDTRQEPLPEEGRPPAGMLNLPVVVLSDSGEFLGVTSPVGRPFTLSQFEAFLAARQGDGLAERRWTREGQEWTLRLTLGGKTHDHHFLQAVTPRGNAVARFASLSVEGVRASEAALQAFLRQVKESFTA